jgi:EAL domain-containing protein (putative c-di-GMP-specific phosphodiesterase class I)
MSTIDSSIEACVNSLNQHILRGTPFGLLVGEIDAANRVSAKFGYEYAEAFQRSYREQLDGLLPGPTLVHRLTDRKFALVLENLADDVALFETAAVIAKQAPPSVHDAQDRFVVDVTLGLASFPRHGEEAGALLRRAELALCSAQSRELPYDMYRPEDTRKLTALWQMESQLDAAIRSRNLEVHYQPKIRIEDGAVVGVEALARWQVAGRGFIAPDTFIPLAERSGLIEPLTWFIMDLVAYDVATWDFIPDPFSVAVNVTPAILMSEPFLERVEMLRNLLARMGSGLIVELTEESIVENTDVAAAMARRLRETGVGIALDDFGRGYSSMSNLRHIPADELKIDRSFLMAMNAQDADWEIVRATIELAHRLNLYVCAEGVDSRAVWSSLTQLGCDFAQGFYFARPLPSAQVSLCFDNEADTNDEL